MDDLTISTTLLSEHWEITVIQNKDSVDLTMAYLVNGEDTDESLGACLTPKFARELGAILANAGFETEPDDNEDD